MSDGGVDDPLYWVDPQARGIIPLDGFHMSRSLKRTIMRAAFTVRVNTCFSEVVKHCADRSETWINPEICKLYQSLHLVDHAHSVEVFEGDTLVGGLYGVSLGQAFFGESMFSLRNDTSKIAVAYLVARLRFGGFTLLDTQFVTDHLKSLGAIEVPRADYHAALEIALSGQADFNALPTEVQPSRVVHLSTQTS